MRLATAVLVTGLALLAAPVHAATFQYLFDGGYPLAVSYDGSVVAGNLSNGSFGPFRWTQATGAASLGRVTHVGGGGVPGISWDGKCVASSIASLDSSYTTQGMWRVGSGWQELMPPNPADGGSIDGSYGNIWGLSGNGQTAVGLYWRAGAGNRAHASKWTQATGVVDLGGTVTGQSSRANGVNFDGSVIAGWVETPTGPWRPAAWVDGTLQLLSAYSDVSVNGTGEARAVAPNGQTIVGFARDPASGQNAAVMWTRAGGGAFGPPQNLGWIEGSAPGAGKTIPYGVSSDGRVVVGWASFEGDPFDVTGWVWTAANGLLDVNVFLANNGVFVDPNFQIKSLNAITPDGTQIFGYGQMLTAPFAIRAFRVTIPSVAGVAPQASSAQLELSKPSPNPTAAGSRLEFALALPSSADLSIFDASGRRVTTLLHADLSPGRRSVTWSGQDESGRVVPAGLYFARLTTPAGALSQRIIRVN